MWSQRLAAAKRTAVGSLRDAATSARGNGSTVAVTTVVRGDPESESLTVLSIDGGCVVEVRVYGPTEQEP